MRIALTGANGLLGQAVCRRLVERETWSVLATSRDEASRVPGVDAHRRLDVTDREAVLSTARSARADVWIHCAARTRVDACEEHVAQCRSVNVEGTRHVVDAAEATGARLVHLSTDFVFDGRDGPYAEDDPVGPVNEYGRSKLESERIVRESALSEWAIARTVLVYGIGRSLGRSNVVLWLLRELAEERPVQIVTDQIRTPTYVEDLSAGIERLVPPGPTGVFHLAGPDLCSVYEFARLVARVFGADPALVEPTESDALGQRAVRPPRTGLRIGKARRTIGFQPRSIEAALHDLRPLVDWPIDRR